MKHILKYTICCLCLVHDSVIGFCSDIFPITKTLKEVPKGYIEDLHKFLCKKVLQGHEKYSKAKYNKGTLDGNRFACAFVIKTNRDRLLRIYINDIPPQEFSKNEKSISGLLKNFDTKKHEKEGNVVENIKEKIFGLGSFRRTNQIPLYCLVKENKEIDKVLQKICQDSTVGKENDISKLFFASISLTLERSQSDSTWYRKYNNDSELHALYALEKMGKEITNCFKSLLIENEQITSIEFHGCTTRDMCALCYTNMNAMQLMANKREKIGMLGTIIARLQEMRIAVKECESATFISSVKAFPETNLLMSNPVPTGTISSGFVYQFRFSEPQVGFKKDSEKTSKNEEQIYVSDDRDKSIKEIDEKTLRDAARVYDLNVKGYPSWSYIPNHPFKDGIYLLPFAEAQLNTDTDKSSVDNDLSQSSKR